MRKKGMRLLCLIGVVVFLMGCATSPVGKAYDVLYASAVVYDTALTYAGDEYRAGRISEDQKSEIVVYAGKYRAALLLGQSALFTYKEAITLGEDLSGPVIGRLKDRLTFALDAVQVARNVLISYIQFTGGDL